MSATASSEPAFGSEEFEAFYAALPLRLRAVTTNRPLTEESLPAYADCSDDPALSAAALAALNAEKASGQALAARYRALAELFEAEDSTDRPARRGSGEDDASDISTLRAATALRITHGAAFYELRNAHRAVEQLPGTLRLLEEGRFSSWRFQKILRRGEDLSAESRRLLDEVIARWHVDIPAARFVTLLNMLVDLLTRREEELAPEPLSESAIPRRVALARGATLGTGDIVTTGPVHEALSFWKRLDTAARAVQAAQRRALREQTEIPHDPDGTVAASGRPLGLDRLRYELQHTAEFHTDGVDLPSARFRLNVTVPVLTLLGADDSPGMVEGTHPLPAEMARDLAGREEVWYRVLTDGSSGTFLPLPADRYTPTPAMLEHLRLRNATCAVPGCTRPTSWASECDHIEEFDHRDPAHGGSTSLENLHMLCWQHHQDKTDGLLDPTRLPTPARSPGRTRWRIGDHGDHVTSMDDTDFATTLAAQRILADWESARETTAVDPRVLRAARSSRIIPAAGATSPPSTDPPPSADEDPPPALGPPPY